MKKYTKVCLIVCCTFVIAGVICLIASLSMKTKWNDIINTGFNNNWFVHHYSNNISDDKINSSDGIKLENDTLSYKNVKDMYIDLSAANLKIKDSDDTDIKIKKSGQNSLYKVENEKNTLKIIGTTSADGNDELIIYIPKNYEFNNINIEIGAGKANVKEMIGKHININVNAGELIIKNFKCEDSNLECNVGEMNISLLDGLKNYTYNLTCDLGQIVLGENEYSGISNKVSIGSGNQQISADCNMGQIVLK